MRSVLIQSAVFNCIEHAQGCLDAAEQFIACLRADDAWGVPDVDMIELLAMPLVGEDPWFVAFCCPPHLRSGADDRS
jgi:hypothetical protein